MKSKHIALLRISYWVGAVADAVAAILMLSPRASGLALGIAGFEPASDYRYAMSMGASLMIGWVFLLIWADRRPMERKGVLLLTIVPGIVGLMLLCRFSGKWTTGCFRK